MSFKSIIFGPDARATVTITDGKAEEIEIHHPNKKSSTKIPGEWAADFVGKDQEIIDAVSKSLGGAKVVAKAKDWSAS